MISDECLNKVLTECKEAAGDIPITFFEGTTAAVPCIFTREGWIYVAETGMGGRLDATNIFTRPYLQSSLPFRSRPYGVLRETLEKIAAEKAAIMKAGVPCIVGKQAEAAAKVANCC